MVCDKVRHSYPIFLVPRYCVGSLRFAKHAMSQSALSVLGRLQVEAASDIQALLLSSPNISLDSQGYVVVNTSSVEGPVYLRQTLRYQLHINPTERSLFATSSTSSKNQLLTPNK